MVLHIGQDLAEREANSPRLKRRGPVTPAGPVLDKEPAVFRLKSSTGLAGVREIGTGAGAVGDRKSWEKDRRTSFSGRVTGLRSLLGLWVSCHGSAFASHSANLFSRRKLYAGFF